MRSFLVVITFVLAAAARAQEIGVPEDSLLIGMRVLEGSDLAIYRGLETGIECAFAPHEPVATAVETMQRWTAAIDETGLFPAAKNDLSRSLTGRAFAAVDQPLTLATALLSAPDAAVHDLAFDYIMNAGGAIEHEGIRRELLRLLDDARSSAEIRATIVWMFASAEAFSEVSEIALMLAGKHDDPHLAHSVARSIVDAHDDEGAIARFADSPIRALREEARRAAYRCGQPATPSTTAMLRAVAGDASEPAWVRGDAIETIGQCVADPANQAALLELLERSQWFFGAIGNHFLIHSLALVIRPLAELKQPDIRARLVRLRSEVATLPPGEREYVEWVLANALDEHREVFYGAVKP